MAIAGLSTNRIHDQLTSHFRRAGLGYLGGNGEQLYAFLEGGAGHATLTRNDWRNVPLPS